MPRTATRIRFKYDWPSREEWAERRRSAYWDSESPHPYRASGKLSHYASPEEITAAITGLKKPWADYGRQMKAAAAKAGPLARQAGERDTVWVSRFLSMGGEDRELAGESECIRADRREINRLIKELRDGSVSWGNMRDKLPLLDTIVVRYEAAVQAGDEKFIAECAARPVDDAAWQAELEWRARWDAGA
ncbi:hypothetical protein G6321_00011880 [Bradyrhizobium barranii subsp. barranii]|uniref:Uncharacterized protein n=1 Tax=Bradyrhizobium barranii subsp. barranii TaxID=2823807 RepID=A0A7Z0Q800_9BRAD|nr:hypothetical protein [Bradyrhizobium barranii]UGX95790.1 hypothetical protein G6321_00011880 [Bradyrhizobium barranii subsp. barranii]